MGRFHGHGGCRPRECPRAGPRAGPGAAHQGREVPGGVWGAGTRGGGAGAG